MSKPFTRSSIALMVPALLVITTFPASATTSTKTWVSSTGTDSGTCQLAAPCKSFQYAHNQTTPGGEIDVKDTGSYGQLTITQAISIVSGDGALAAVGAPSGGNGIVINAGPQDRVVLEGLVVDGHGVGSNGIVFYTGYSLTVVNCHVRNVTSDAIAITPGDATFYDVENTEVANSGEGIDVTPASNSRVDGTIANDIIHYNQLGVNLTGTTNTLVTNDVIMGNVDGVKADASQANVLIGQSTISQNSAYGLINIVGTIQTYGDNYINANGTDTYGTISGIQRK